MANKRRIVVAMTGASGSILCVRLLDALKALSSIEIHLIVSDAAKVTLSEELKISVKDLEPGIDVIHQNRNIGASLASGSFHHDGMIVLPCSIKTLSAIANCFSSDLISRAADVSLKEGRKLLLGVRETPFHGGHLDLMKKATDFGAIIFPPIPAFYQGFKSNEEMVDRIVGRILMRIGIENKLFKSWNGLEN